MFPRRPGGGYVEPSMFGMDMGPPVPLMDPRNMLLWDATRMLNDALSYRDSRRIADTIHQMEYILDRTRIAYNDALAERDAVRDQLVEAEQKLTEVQRAVQRYTVVQEPVVASDGFTYEQGVIRQYLDECAESNTQAYSQQTKEPLNKILIPNQSLKKLVELLKTVTPQEVPAAVPRSRLGPLHAAPSSTATTAEVAADPSAPAAQRNGSGIDWTNEVDEQQQQQQQETAQQQQQNETAEGEDGAPNNGSSGDAPEKAWARPNPNVASSAKPTTTAPAAPVARVAATNSATTTSSSSSSGANPSGKLHPCLRVYGLCNFEDSCQFALYPFDACLNNIKGKCRFGSVCKEFHVANPADPKYINPKSNNNNHNVGASDSINKGGSPKKVE